MILYLENLWVLFVDMSFYIVIGLIFTGFLHAFVKKDVILKHIGKDSTGAVVKASVLGVPLPLCSCGVVPTAMYLGKSGASKGAVVSFLTSTPQTGVDSLVATYGMMGGLFAVYRAIAAFISGIISGILTNLFCKKDEMKYDTPKTSCCSQPKEETQGSTCCSSKKQEMKVSPCCGSLNLEVQKKSTCCCSKEEKIVVETPKSSCCCQSNQTASENHRLQDKIKKAFTYGFGEFLDEIALHFVIGLLLAAFISTLLPTSIFSRFNNPLIVMVMMVIIGIPMYICSTASIPIAVSLMMKGISPGAAFVFLFAGPVTNIASISIILQTLGKKVTAIYLSCAALCAIGFGLMLDYIIHLTNYQGISNMLTHTHTHGTPLYMSMTAIIFGILVIKSLWKRFNKKTSCGCGHSH